MIGKKDKVYNELDFLINCLDDDLRNKIPQKYINEINEKKIKGYFPKIDTNLPLEKQDISKDAFAMLGMIYLKYICNNNEERKDFLTQLIKK